MADRSAATSGQTTDDGLGDGLLAAVLPPDEQPVPSSAIAATRHAPASPALMPGTLPPARARVLTHAGLVALQAALRVISMIDFYFPCERADKLGGLTAPRGNSMIGFHLSRETCGQTGQITLQNARSAGKVGWQGWPDADPECRATPAGR
jgi:hypothetical protein